MEPVTTDIYTLSLHDALPICLAAAARPDDRDELAVGDGERHIAEGQELLFLTLEIIAVGHVIDEDRKSTRLNSSHTVISYAVFCLKKKKLFVSHEVLERLDVV